MKKEFKDIKHTKPNGRDTMKAWTRRSNREITIPNRG